MSYKLYAALSVFLLFKYDWNALLWWWCSCESAPVVVFALLLFAYSKLIGMPSLAVIEHFPSATTGQDHLVDFGSPTKTASTYEPIDPRNQFNVNDSERFASVKTTKNGLGSATIKAKPSIKCNYSNICNYFNNGFKLKTNARVEEVKKTFFNKPPQPQHISKHNEQLENDKCLFTPGKVSEIAEIFQKNCAKTPSKGSVSNGVKNGNEKPLVLAPLDSMESSLTQNDNVIEEFQTCNAYQSHSDKLSYSWVFGENCVENGKSDLENILPDSTTDVDFHLGELRSFKQKDTLDAGADNKVNGILKEVLTCNVIDQKTCDWRSVKKELKSLDKLKPVAIIDPLTLPSTKLNGFDAIKGIDSPWYSAENTNEMNGYNDSKINASYDEPDSKSKYDFDQFNFNQRVNFLNEYNGYLNNQKGIDSDPSEDLSTFKSINGYRNQIEKNHHQRRSPDSITPIRPLSPILEINQENDNFSSTVSSSSDKSSCMSADFYIGTYPTERGESGMNSFCISPEELYSYSRVNASAEETAAVAQQKSIEQSVSLNMLPLTTTISIPVSLPSSKICTSECQVFFRSGVLTQLEALRDDKLADRVIKFQAYCRGYLSRKRLAKLKIEDVAIRCIQRNVRKFMLVRDWPWWRLLVRITPLLNVHRTEQELKTKTEELEAFRIQCEKLEQERNTLKQENAKLDAKLSELSVDLAEEHSAAHLASERLDLETAERMRLENEVQHLQAEKKKLQESSEKLETELLCMKTAEVNGIIGIDDDDSLSIGDDNSSGSGGVYKQRYERALRELEYTKRRLQQQHHDDLEQLIALRKQLEKKIADAYEEVEEQRQVVAQWKRKVQKLNGEMSDLRLMLEDSNSRNNLLEKKQRKFDSELLLLQEELRQEKQNRERVVREKDIVSAEKYTLEQNLSALKVDLELKEQKLLNLNRELQEISYGGNTEEEISRLRKVKHELENRIAEQDEELDDLAGQVELLNQAKLRLQMDLEQVRKEHKKEINQRDDESEKIRLNTTKKVKALECQLENEHEERTMLLRERHELERKLAEIEDRERCNRSADLETLNRLRRDLKKTKILLHDAQLMLQQAKLDAPSKAILRQLRNQLEDAECARNAAVKARQLAEADLADITSMLEDVQKAKSDAEEKATLYSREKSQLQSQLDENEEELAEVLKKYRNTVQQLSNEQLILHEQANRIAELESERSSLKDQLAEVTSRLENIETHGDPTSSLTVKRLELKTKELESKLDLEQTTRSRMEVQIGRLKEAAERLQHDADIARSKEASAQENVRKLQRALRDAREVQSNYESKEATESARKRELEKKVEQLETELSSAKADLKLALQRVDDLQCAIQGDLDDNDDDQTDSDNDDSGSSNASLQSFLLQSNGETSIHKWLNNGAGSENSKI
ncbi:unconventional myosin-XVIIIa isoform X4 [Planococcus citri]|uniref:unconventional myosin-XVIIIa isoform X4 n=1 Tax=Planococcus citri TaxID=170843 RepID=UPI0031F93A2D